MAKPKLYWRYKKDGKWTWKAFEGDIKGPWPQYVDLELRMEEEE